MINNCKQCYSTGVIAIANGADDFDWEGCPVCHKEPKDYGLDEEVAKVEYLSNSPF